MKHIKSYFTICTLVCCIFLLNIMPVHAAKKAELNRTTVTAYPKMESIKLKVKNISATKKVTWSSDHPAVVSVDAAGNLTFLKNGNAVITAKIGKKSLKCIASVCSKKSYKAVEKAKQFYYARNISYSQGNRMGSRQADCSSFCGRCYLGQNITMGGSKSWCNTAAGMAAWATKTKKVVANSGVSISSKRLLPGDLVFYKGPSNGRYKNIYHVEIFTGYAWNKDALVGYTMSSIRGNYPSILKRDYTSRKYKVAQISRPAN